MILSEQLLKRLNRFYYHGQQFENRDKSKAFFKSYYLTTDPFYAYQFAHEDGWIKVHRFKKGLDICNCRSKKDAQKIEDFCRKNNYQEAKIFIEKLAEEDWLSLFQTPSCRDEFIDALQTLGYDGYFNIESEDPTNGRLERKTNIESRGFPAIGIFDESCLETVQILHTLKEFETLPMIKNIHENEVSYLKRELCKIYEEYKKLDNQAILELLKYVSNYFSITNRIEVLNILNNFNYEKESKKLTELREWCTENNRPFELYRPQFRYK